MRLRVYVCFLVYYIIYTYIHCWFHCFVMICTHEFVNTMYDAFMTLQQICTKMLTSISLYLSTRWAPPLRNLLISHVTIVVSSITSSFPCFDLSFVTGVSTLYISVVAVFLYECFSGSKPYQVACQWSLCGALCSPYKWLHVAQVSTCSVPQRLERCHALLRHHQAVHSFSML